MAKVVRRVKAEVRKIPPPREYYDLSDFTFSKTVADTSETLLRLVSALVSDGNVTKPPLTISQTMQPHISGASNQATIGFDISCITSLEAQMLSSCGIVIALSAPLMRFFVFANQLPHMFRRTLNIS